MRAGAALERRLGWIEREGQRTDEGDLAPTIYRVRHDALAVVVAELAPPREVQSAPPLAPPGPTSSSSLAPRAADVGPAPRPGRPQEGRSCLPPDLPGEAAAARAHTREGFADVVSSSARSVSSDRPGIGQLDGEACPDVHRGDFSPLRASAAQAILGALVGALSPIASGLFARRLADEVTSARPLSLVLQGLRELEAAAGDAALFGQAWSPLELARASRKWIRGARPERSAPEDERPWGAARMAPDTEPLPPPMDPRRIAAGAKGVLGAIQAA